MLQPKGCATVNRRCRSTARGDLPHDLGRTVPVREDARLVSTDDKLEQDEKDLGQKYHQGRQQFSLAHILQVHAGQMIPL